LAQTKNLLLFRKWDLSEIEVKDPGLKTAISLRKQILPYTFGRSALKRFNKAEVNIVERLCNKLMHFGKKYAKNTGRMTGKKIRVLNTVKVAFDIISLKTGENPVEVLVRAVEYSAPNEDTTRIVYAVKVFAIVNKAEVDVFLELSCFFDDPTDVGNLISDSSAFSKSSLNIWKFLVHILLKPSLENFEHDFASM